MMVKEKELANRENRWNHYETCHTRAQLTKKDVDCVC